VADPTLAITVKPEDIAARKDRPQTLAVREISPLLRIFRTPEFLDRIETQFSSILRSPCGDLRIAVTLLVMAALTMRSRSVVTAHRLATLSRTSCLLAAFLLVAAHRHAQNSTEAVRFVVEHFEGAIQVRQPPTE
jgi:hypothetical protein